MKVNTEYKKPVTLESIFLGEMFEYRPNSVNEDELDGFDGKDGTPINTPLIRVARVGGSDAFNADLRIKEGYLLAVDPYKGYIYMIPRDKKVIPLESELTVKK